MLTKVESFGQYFTPFWAAERLVEHYFDFEPNDIVIEPTCGPGAFLAAVPKHIQAIGVEIDPELASQATSDTGRRVICGDFRTLDLNIRPTIAIGNPPFNSKLFQEILFRLSEMMEKNARCGFILPAYFFQYASITRQYADRWRVQADHLPRGIFPRLSKPLVFALFERSHRGRLIGFALYDDVESVQRMKAAYRQLLMSSQQSAWRRVVIEAFYKLGGEATLQELYEEISSRRPTRNPWWHAKIRQIVQHIGRRISRGRYALDELLLPKKGIQLRMCV